MNESDCFLYIYESLNMLRNCEENTLNKFIFMYLFTTKLVLFTVNVDLADHLRFILNWLHSHNRVVSNRVSEWCLSGVAGHAGRPSWPCGSCSCLGAARAGRAGADVMCTYSQPCMHHGWVSEWVSEWVEISLLTHCTNKQHALVSRNPKP